MKNIRLIRNCQTKCVDLIEMNSGGLKTKRFDENSKSDFSHKTNTFSYDENVKDQ